MRILNNQEKKRSKNSEWIVKNFPKDYLYLDYLEPYGGVSVLLKKDPSNFEAINIDDETWTAIFRALRDEPKLLLGKIKRLKFSEKTFEAYRNKQKSDDYIKNAVRELVLYKMSIGGKRKKFGGAGSTWEHMIKSLYVIADRIKFVHIFDHDVISIIKAFNQPESLLFIEPPHFDDTQEVATLHLSLADILNQVYSKVVVYYPICTFYNNHYSAWRCVKKANSKEALWLNY